MDNNNNNNEASSIVVSNDTTSKKIKVDKNTKLENFYQLIINKFNQNNKFNMNLFYYEGYSHEKLFISNEKEYVIANKKGIEYFYFCSDSSNNNDKYSDYLKYHSVIIFSPIKILNHEYQNNERKKMQIKNFIPNKNQKNINNNSNNNMNSNNMMMNNQMGMKPMMMNNQMGMKPIMMNNQIGMNPMKMNNQIGINPMIMNNQMGMNPMMMNNQMGINPMMMNNPMGINPMMMNNPMGINPMMMNQNMMYQMFMGRKVMNNNIINPFIMNNNMNYNNLNSAMVNNMMNQLFKIYSSNPMMGLNMMKKLNPNFLIKCFQILEKDDKNNNKINNKEISEQQQLYPNKFVNITITLSNPGLLNNTAPSKEDYKYILCLIGKILENNGIKVGILKENIIKDRIDLSAIQFIFSGLINKKKYRLKLSVNEDKIKCLKNKLEYKKIFINRWKEIIANKLNVDKKLIILTNPRQEGSLFLDLAFNPKVEIFSENYIKQKLVDGEIIDCKMIPLLEACRLSPNIFNKNFHKYYDNTINNIQRRGGEEYLPPSSWTAYGINVLGKYDFGNNAWLSNNNGLGEFAVAYYGINNLFNNNMNMIQNLIGLMGNQESGRTFINANNNRNPGEKCKTGAYFYRNPNYAENSSETIKIGGFNYKIMFMCRVNPLKIRQPENFLDCWILNPSPDEVRPYKILIKKIPKSPLAIASQQTIKMCLTSPDPSYKQILHQKDESFFNQKNNSGYRNLSNYDYALKLYSQASSINNYLRNPNTHTNYSRSNVWCLHQACTQKNSGVTDGTILYRGVCFKLPNDIGIGTKFFFPEFLSTSRDINIAKNIAGKGTLMHITVQNNGTNGKKVYCRDIEYISDYPFQKEILFTSHCEFRITNIEKTPNLDILYLTCEGHHF